MEKLDILKKFKGLGNAPEVMKAKEKKEKQTGQKVKGDFESLMQNYLNQFTKFQKAFSELKRERVRERGAERFKRLIADKFLTKYEDIQENYWTGPFMREIEEQGLLGDWNGMDEKEKEKYKKDHAKPLLEDQKASIEEWLDYFLSEGSDDIPDYLKYWIFRSVTGLQEYEKPKDYTKEKIEEQRTQKEEAKKQEGQFPRRSKNSLKKFPDLHPEALRYVTDAIIKKYKGEAHEFEYDIQPEEREKFQQYLEQENFAKLYAWAMELINPIPEHLLAITEGEWKRYPQGTNVEEVVKTLRGKGTGLCIAGKGAASQYLRNGDLHIYYSNDEEGHPVFPRLAIHAKGDQIAEMRGIAYKQNLDPFITDVAKSKLKEFKNGASYEKRTTDMKKLTEIKDKTQANQKLNKEEIIFLYEIDSPIEYAGLVRDPRIEEIKKTRNIQEDASIVFECSQDQIAHHTKEINENTKAYIGEWNVKIFQKIKNYPNITHLYESFPDKKIFMQTLETDPRINSPAKAKGALREKNIYLSDWSKDMLQKTKFSKEKKEYNLVRFTVEQLGFPDGATTDEIYAKAKKLGLELCPAEVGPHLRLQYPGKEWMLIAMEQITDRRDDPDLFYLGWHGEQLKLTGLDAGPCRRWDADDKFVFCSRK